MQQGEAARALHFIAVSGEHLDAFKAAGCYAPLFRILDGSSWDSECAHNCLSVLLYLIERESTQSAAQYQGNLLSLLPKITSCTQHSFSLPTPTEGELQQELSAQAECSIVSAQLLKTVGELFASSMAQPAEQLWEVIIEFTAANNELCLLNALNVLVHNVLVVAERTVQLKLVSDALDTIEQADSTSSTRSIIVKALVVRLPCCQTSDSVS